MEALNTKLQSLNQEKPKSFVTAKVDRKNAWFGLRPCTFQLPATQRCTTSTNRAKMQGLAQKHAKMHGLVAKMLISCSSSCYVDCRIRQVYQIIY